jgi:hypothetical protein
MFAAVVGLLAALKTATGVNQALRAAINRLAATSERGREAV